jgi:hypothetical protein
MCAQTPTRKCSIGALFVTAAAVLLGACAPLAQRDDLGPRQWKRVATTLERDGTPDALVTAALIRQASLRESAGALADLDRALRLSPQQPDVAWLALNICADTRGCAPALRATALLDLDPRNATASYAALTDAHEDGDAVAEDRALAAMADASYFDIYWSQLLTRATDALAQPRGRAQHPLLELPQAMTEVVSWLAAVAIPPFTATSITCKGDRLKRNDIVEWCRKLAGVLDNGDTYIAQAIGRAIAFRVWAPDTTEAARFRQRLREFDYVQEATEPYNDSVHESVANTQRWLNRFRSNRSERDVYRAWLTDLGIPAEPPIDWEPKSAKKE